jgi:hypothetical protein
MVGLNLYLRKFLLFILFFFSFVRYLQVNNAKKIEEKRRKKKRKEKKFRHVNKEGERNLGEYYWLVILINSFCCLFFCSN